jgi:hypothetical protein
MRSSISLVLFLGLAGPVLGEDISGGPKGFTVISPIFSQLVAFKLPTPFKTAFENATATQYIREAVPHGETVKAWTQMITVTGYKQLASNPRLTPRAFASQIARGFQRNCPETFSSAGFGEKKLGDHIAFLSVAGCGSVAGSPDKHGEIALLITIKGEADYYTIQWAERQASSPQRPRIDTEKWFERIDKLGPIKLCAIIAEEKAPFPSCVEGL